MSIAGSPVDWARSNQSDVARVNARKGKREGTSLPRNHAAGALSEQGVRTSSA